MKASLQPRLVWAAITAPVECHHAHAIKSTLWISLLLAAEANVNRKKCLSMKKSQLEDKSFSSSFYPGGGTMTVIRRLLAAIRRETAPAERDLMTMEEVAVRVGVDVPVIRRRIATGDIPAVRIGGALRVERTALERTIAIIAANYGPPS